MVMEGAAHDITHGVGGGGTAREGSEKAANGRGKAVERQWKASHDFGRGVGGEVVVDIPGGGAGPVGHLLKA